MVLLNGQLLFDFEFFHALAQGGPRDAQQLGGLDLVAFGFQQRLDDQFPFHRRQHFEFALLAAPIETTSAPPPPNPARLRRPPGRGRAQRRGSRACPLRPRRRLEISAGRSPGKITSPLAMTMARWITFSSSRTLPGQWNRSSISSRRRQDGFGGAPLRLGELLQKIVDEQRDVLAPLAQRAECGCAPRSAGKTSPRGIRAPATACSSGLCVAAITRTSTLMDWLPPTRSNAPDWRTRRILAWVASVMSPISSRKIVPPSHCSNLPMRWAAAPVNAPFFVAEQFAFQQVLRDGGAIDGQEGLRRCVCCDGKWPAPPVPCPCRFPR